MNNRLDNKLRRLIRNEINSINESPTDFNQRKRDFQKIVKDIKRNIPGTYWLEYKGKHGYSAKIMPGTEGWGIPELDSKTDPDIIKARKYLKKRTDVIIAEETSIGGSGSWAIVITPNPSLFK